jgi:hypothetical protein
MDCLFRYGRFFITTFFFKRLSFFFLIEGFLVSTIIPYIAFAFLLLGTIEINLQMHMLYSVLIATTGGAIGSILYSLEAVHLAKNYNIKLVEKRKLIYTIFLELLFYRYVIIGINMYGTIAYFFNKHSWNKVSRTGRNYEIVNHTQKMDIS